MSEERLQDEFKTMFLDDADFSETVSYTATGAAAKSIKAVVYRKGYLSYRQSKTFNNTSMKYNLEMKISRNATDGIAAITEKSDSVSLPEEIGGTASTWRILGIISSDGGCWHLGIGR